MAEENNSANKGAEDSKGKPPEGQPAEEPKVESSNQAVDPAEQARRDQQSKKDRANSENDDLRETVDFLSSREAERARDSYVSDLLTKDAEKFPNVKADDPMFKYATSKEDVEDIATKLQNKYTDMQQDALRSVQAGEDEKPLTDEEIAEREKELEKEADESGRSTFGGFLDTITRRKK